MRSLSDPCVFDGDLHRSKPNDSVTKTQARAHTTHTQSSKILPPSPEVFILPRGLYLKKKKKGRLALGKLLEIRYYFESFI